MDPLVVPLALGSAVCFGLALVMVQFGLRGASPMRGASISVPTAAAMFLVLSPFTIEFGEWKLEAVGLFALAGCLFPASVTLLTFEANRRIGPSMTGALGNLTPLFAVGLAVIILGETPRMGQVAGIGIITLGVAMLFGVPQTGPGRYVAWAIVFPLLGALIRGLVQPVVKSGMEVWANPFAAITIGYVVSASVVVVAAAISGDRRQTQVNLNGRMWFMAVGMVNGLAVLGLYAALARGPVTVVAPLVAGYPLATMVFSRLFLGAGSLNKGVILGIAVTVSGVVVLLIS